MRYQHRLTSPDITRYIFSDWSFSWPVLFIANSTVVRMLKTFL